MSSLRLLPIALLAACVGGGGSDDSGATDDSGADDSATPAACASLDQAACEARSDCASILGAPEDEVCAGDYSNWRTIWAGCMDGELGCGDAETCGKNPETGETLMFSNTCLPDGWDGCEYCP
ncbi:MAG: hypothetical protein H6739_09710 [Alphaproteobacteria bacterium]|nr:hypothetical protein [Alphaproteobacteria bacterium]